MRLERLTINKIKIFLTAEDLFERGLTKEDIWKDSLKWHQLFHDLLQEANQEFGVDFHGTIAVEIFSLQAQGMIMIITADHAADEEQILADDFLEMEVRVGEFEIVLYEFESIEEVIGSAEILACMNIHGGSLYSFRERYYLLMKDLDAAILEKAVSVLSEYGNVSIISPIILEEYGNKIIENNAVDTIFHYFKRK